MTDITSRFYAYMGVPFQNRNGLISYSSRMEEVQSISREIDMKLSTIEKAATIYEIQSDIETLEDILASHKDYVSMAEKNHYEIMIETMYMKMREKLCEIQKRDIFELKRQMNVDEYFKPKNMVGIVGWKNMDRGDEKFVKPVIVPSNGELESEAEILLATYQSSSEIVTVRSRIAETSTLMSMLSSKAIEQVDLADSILSYANDSIAYIDKADDQLNRAIQHNSSYRFYVVMWFMTLSMILLILDFIK